MPPKEKIPYALILQKTHLRLLWHQAKTVGFTGKTIWHLLHFLNRNPYTMSTYDFMTLMPYINEINAQKFNY